MDNETNRPSPMPARPQTTRLLTAAAAMVVLAVIGAVTLSVALWVNDGSPTVAASFGGNRGGPGPGRGGGPTINQAPRGQQDNGANPQPGPNGPNAPNQGNQQAGTAGAGRLSREADLSGFVGGVSNGSITVQTLRGARQVTLTPSTKVYRLDGTAVSIRDITVGWSVAVVTAPGATLLTATEVAQIQPVR